MICKVFCKIVVAAKNRPISYFNEHGVLLPNIPAREFFFKEIASLFIEKELLIRCSACNTPYSFRIPKNTEQKRLVLEPVLCSVSQKKMNAFLRIIWTN